MGSPRHDGLSRVDGGLRAVDEAEAQLDARLLLRGGERGEGERGARLVRVRVRVRARVRVRVRVRLRVRLRLRLRVRVRVRAARRACSLARCPRASAPG